MSDDMDTKSSKRFRWLDGWSRLLLEMLAITFGVLLAFTLNAWWQSAQAQKLQDKSLSMIEAELDRNVEKLITTFEYRKALYPDFLAVKAGRKKVEDVPYRGTLPPRIERAAYELAQSNAIFAAIDPTEAQEIIKIYLDLQNIENTHSIYANSLPMLMIDFDDENDPRIVEFMRTAFMDYMYAEGEAINAIRAIKGQDEPIEVWKIIQNFHEEDAKLSQGQAENPN